MSTTCNGVFGVCRAPHVVWSGIERRRIYGRAMGLSQKAPSSSLENCLRGNFPEEKHSRVHFMSMRKKTRMKGPLKVNPSIDSSFASVPISLPVIKKDLEDRCDVLSQPTSKGYNSETINVPPNGEHMSLEPNGVREEVIKSRKEFEDHEDVLKRLVESIHQMNTKFGLKSDKITRNKDELVHKVDEKLKGDNEATIEATDKSVITNKEEQRAALMKRKEEVGKSLVSCGHRMDILLDIVKRRREENDQLLVTKQRVEGRVKVLRDTLQKIRDQADYTLFVKKTF